MSGIPKPLGWILAAVLAAYGIFVFPSAYFRHDDWLILGNAVRVFAENPSTAFHPTLFYVEEEVVWFFRPLFKAIVYLFFELFGYHYYLWLSAILLCYAGAIFFFAAAIRELDGSVARACTFVALAVGAVHIHFGSLFWMGEGMMNCPQLLLLGLNLYLVARAQNGAPGWHVPALLAFVLALGFKESSVFHAGFVVPVLFERSFTGKRPVNDRLWAAAYAAIGAIYLYFRLFHVPINPYYVPKGEVFYFLRGIAILSASLLAIAAVFGFWSLRAGSRARELLSPAIRKWWAVGFLAVTFVPYLGHPFFSPGWLLFPGVYFALILALFWPPLPARSLAPMALTLVVVTSIPVAWKIVKLRWWHWKAGQVALVEAIDRAPADAVKSIHIYSCSDESHPELAFDRIVGFEAGVYQLWALRHGATVPVTIRSCGRLTEKHRTARNKLVLKWEFPRLEWLNAESLIASRDPAR